MGSMLSHSLGMEMHKGLGKRNGGRKEKKGGNSAVVLCVGDRHTCIKDE